MLNKKVFAFVLVFVVMVLVIGNGSAFAYGEDIQSSLTDLLNWVSKILGGLAVGFGIVFTGLRMAMHDEHALKNGMLIIGGGILIFAAMNIVNLLQAIFKGA